MKKYSLKELKKECKKGAHILWMYPMMEPIGYYETKEKGWFGRIKTVQNPLYRGSVACLVCNRWFELASPKIKKEIYV